MMIRKMKSEPKISSLLQKAKRESCQSLDCAERSVVNVIDNVILII